MVATVCLPLESVLELELEPVLVPGEKRGIAWA